VEGKNRGKLKEEKVRDFNPQKGKRVVLQFIEMIQEMGDVHSPYPNSLISWFGLRFKGKCLIHECVVV
jgi:hypothetical protein